MTGCESPQKIIEIFGKTHLNTKPWKHMSRYRD